MSHLLIAPHAGIDTRFPEHKITNYAKGGTQKCRALNNMFSLDGRFYLAPGATRFDASDKGGNVVWLKRVYYQDSHNLKRHLFGVIGGKIYKADESTRTLNQVTINNDLNISLEPNFYPISAIAISAGTPCLYMCDGKYIYKFSGNAAGNWDRLPLKLNLDGETIQPIFIAECLDRLWILDRTNNKLVGSNNLDPETTDDPNDSILLVTPPGNGGFPQALIKYRNNLFIYHDDYFVPMSGTSPLTFGIRPGDIVEGYGTNAPRSVLIFGSKMGFLNSKDNEFYTTAGTYDSTDQIPLSYDIKLGELIDPVMSGITVCHFDTDLNALRIAYFPSGGTSLGDEEIYSVAEKKWCGQTRGRNISCYAQWNGSGDDGRLSTGRSDVGLVMVNDESINFDGAAIHFKFIGASYVPDDPFDVEFSDFFLDAKPESNADLSIRYYLDARITTNATDGVNMQGEIFTLGFISIADQNVFINRMVPFIDNQKGRMIRFEIEGSSLNQLLEFYGIYCFYKTQETKLNKYLSGRA